MNPAGRSTGCRLRQLVWIRKSTNPKSKANTNAVKITNRFGIVSVSNCWVEPNPFNHSAQAVTNTPIRDARYNAPNSTMAMMMRGSIPAASQEPL